MRASRSAASRLILDDVIDRSVLEQAREGLGGRDIEEPLIWPAVQKEHSGGGQPSVTTQFIGRWISMLWASENIVLCYATPRNMSVGILKEAALG